MPSIAPLTAGKSLDWLALRCDRPERVDFVRSMRIRPEGSGLLDRITVRVLSQHALSRLTCSGEVYSEAYSEAHVSRSGTCSRIRQDLAELEVRALPGIKFSLFFKSFYSGIAPLLHSYS
jgi:hypothetical protein